VKLRLLGRAVFLVALLTVSNEWSVRSAEGQDANQKYENVVRAYLRIAFSATRSRLTRFDLGNPIGAAFNCEGLELVKCKDDEALAGSAMHANENLKIDFFATPKSLSIVFGEVGLISERSIQDKAAFNNGYEDASDPLCQVFYNAKDGIIENAEILVSDDQPVLRKKNLPARSTFSGTWNKSIW